MKKVTFIALSIFTAISLSSCWDFNREQDYKDAENKGKSILIEAESSKKAAIEEAKAQSESAELYAKAAITQANARAEAMLIEANAKSKTLEIYISRLGGVDNYLKYVMIDGAYNHSEAIYVPTEAGIPILKTK